MLSISHRGTAVAHTGVSSQNLTPNATFAAGSWAVLFLSYFNVEVFTSVTDTKGNTWISDEVTSVGSGFLRILHSELANGLTSTDHLTISFSASVLLAASLEEIGGNSLSLVDSDILSHGNSLPSITTPSLATNRTVVGGSIKGWNALTDPGAFTDDLDTLQGTWQSGQTTTVLGGFGLRLTLLTQGKITTGSGAQTYNPVSTFTVPGQAVYASGWIEFSEAIAIAETALEAHALRDRIMSEYLGVEVILHFSRLPDGPALGDWHYRSKDGRPEPELTPYQLLTLTAANSNGDTFVLWEKNDYLGIFLLYPPL